MEQIIPNGSKVIEISTNKEYEVVDVIKTNDQFNQGVYLYRFKGYESGGFGLYCSEIKLIKDVD